MSGDQIPGDQTGNLGKRLIVGFGWISWPDLDQDTQEASRENFSIASMLLGKST